MKKIIAISIILSLSCGSLYAANTEVLTKAMVKLITKQKTLENAIIVLKQNQNKTNKVLSTTNLNKANSQAVIDPEINNKIKALNTQLLEVQKELDFARNISELKIEDDYKYKRNTVSISTIDSFISKNK